MSLPPTRPLPRLITRGWTHESSPFHAGEQRVQRRVGVRDQIERAGRNMIRDQMPDQHREFFELLPFLVVGSIDARGQLWASLLSGAPGFIRSATPQLLEIRARPALGDPLADPLGEQLAIGAPLGLLGIQLETRRRNRANGYIVARDADSVTIEVEQSFGNCKQYIQAREPAFDPTLIGRAAPPRAESALLSARASSLLAQTDTFFISSASAFARAHGDGASDSDRNSEGVDVSHRGGRPGFVRVEHGASATRLTVPDFRGNFMFNTFGNLEVNPRAGIVCTDFSNGDMLLLTGSAHVLWDDPELGAFEGADRLLSFEVSSGVFLERALPLRFQGLVPSPDLAKTGTWAAR